MQESELLGKLRVMFGGGDTVVVGSGPDDCAHVVSPDVRLGMTADAFVEGTHFLETDSPEDIGYKVLAASLSDMAASGCRPLWGLVSLCIRKDVASDWALRFAESVAAVAREFGVVIVGGDVTSSRRGLFVSTTVVGVPLAGGPLLRSGARAGDVVVVTGRLGGSILGRHLRPLPRVREIAGLMEFCADAERGIKAPTACMDISDGLALDLSRLCRESGVGAILEAQLVPVSAAARELSKKTGRGPLAHALSDGEDFELLLTMPERTWREAEREQVEMGWIDAETGAGLFTRIGGIVENTGLRIIDERGEDHVLEPEGYQHQW